MFICPARLFSAWTKAGRTLSNFRNMAEKKKNGNIKSSGELPYEIPVEGSIGLLALGAVGLLEWRKVRDANKDVKKD